MDIREKNFVNERIFLKFCLSREKSMMEFLIWNISFNEKGNSDFLLEYCCW